MDSTNDSDSLSMLDAREIVRDLFGYDFPTPKEQAQFWVREAMTELCGEGHVALATTPPENRPSAPTERDLEQMAIRDGDAGEARLYFFGRRPVNPHGD